jgi:hypothetical protein
MELVPTVEQAGLHPDAKRSLQQEFEESRGVHDDHADSRSARMTTAAGVCNVTRFRLWMASLRTIESPWGCRHPLADRTPGRL